MSTTDQTNKVTFTGNASTVDFAFTFRVFAAADLEVYLDGVLKTLTTHYSVTIDSSVEGGTVTFVTAPGSGVSVLIKRVLAYTQPSDLPTEGNFPEETLENALDRATMLIVQLKEILSRVPQLAIDSDFSDLTLPEPSAGKVLGWNDAGDDLENLNLTQTTVAYSGTISKGVDASKPANPSQGDIYFATDTNVLYKCITGGSWNAVTERVKAASVASATTTAIWTTDGDLVHITGTTTITGFGTALKAGAERVIVFDGILTLTHHATNLILPGGANITTAAGDCAVVRAETTTTARVISYTKASGLSTVAPSFQTAASQAEMEAASSNTVPVTPLSAKWHPGVAKAWGRFDGTGTPAYASSHNMDASITDNGTGDYTVSFATDFSAATAYALVGMTRRAGGTASGVLNFDASDAPAAGTCRILSMDGGSTPVDKDIITFVAFGDQ